MVRVITILAGLLCAFSVSAITNQEILKNLSLRMHPLPNGQGSLIKSFTTHSQSYIYDQALAIIAFSKAKDKKNARQLMNGLKSLQLKDGSLYFSYYLNGKSPYPIEGDKRFAGAISWVALASVHYQSQFNSKEFVDFNVNILNYLQTQIHPIKVKNIQAHALSFSPADVKETAWREDETAALEHNLDAYSAFIHFSKINKETKWNKEIKELNKFILAMWDEDRSHFWSGANIKNGNINRSELYLDNQTWSLLALDDKTLQKLNPVAALNFNCDRLMVKHEGILGFMDSKPTRRPASTQFVWSEGTLGQILAMKKMKMKCDENSSEDFLVSIKKMKKSDGGIAYATHTTNPDFTSSSSVAGTVWLYFASNNFNPFQIDG